MEFLNLNVDTIQSIVILLLSINVALISWFYD